MWCQYIRCRVGRNGTFGTRPVLMASTSTEYSYDHRRYIHPRCVDAKDIDEEVITLVVQRVDAEPGPAPSSSP